MARIFVTMLAILVATDVSSLSVGSRTKEKHAGGEMVPFWGGTSVAVAPYAADADALHESRPNSDHITVIISKVGH